VTPWMAAPVRRVFRIINGGTPTADGDNWDGGVLWATPVDLGQCNGGLITSTARTLTHQGLQTGSAEVPANSLVVSTRAPIGYIAQTIAPLAFNQGCRGLIPTRPVDIRYYRYVFAALTEQLQARGQGSTFVELSTNGLASIPVPIPSLKVQRAIADYLDTETARIDVLIEKKRRMVEVVGDRRSVLIERRIRALAEKWGVRPLKHSVRRVEVGIVVKPSALYSDEGVPTIRGFNVKPGQILLHDIATISEEGDRLHAKSRLRTGDVVVVRTGQAGAAAVVPAALDGYNCIDVVIIRPSVAIIPKYLEFVLNSDWTQKHIDEHSVGTIQAHFNVGAMKDVPIPVPPIEEQQRVIEDLSRAVSGHDRFVEVLVRQVPLLTERRQSLITAAVTGELDIPVVAA
jgi:type I restriction enzyme S subunit